MKPSVQHPNHRALRKRLEEIGKRLGQFEGVCYQRAVANTTVLELWKLKHLADRVIIQYFVDGSWSLFHSDESITTLDQLDAFIVRNSKVPNLTEQEFLQGQIAIANHFEKL